MAVVPDTSLDPPVDALQAPIAAQTVAKLPKARWPYMAALLVLVVAGLGIARALPLWFSGPPPRIVTASGRIEGREVTLAPKDIQGRVKRLLVDEGQTVSKGQLLAELDAAQLEARIIALLSGDPFLNDIFANKKDIHSEFARIVWPTPDAPQPLS